MEYLDLGGKRYIKVSSAARETGYTSDYIGQLCRAKKIDAKLVGRTWYVVRDEITAHKRTRGRSTYEKTRQAVKAAIVDSAGETAIPIHRGSTSAYRARLTAPAVKYHADETALIPEVATVVPPSRHMHVRTSTPRESVVELNNTHTEHLTVDEEGNLVQFNKTAPREVVWNGTIVVSSLEEQEVASPTLAPTKNVSSLERHLRVYREQERNSKVNLGITSTAHDPLEEKARFLERMNLAHDFNANEHVAVSRPRESLTRRSLPARTPLPRTSPGPQRSAIPVVPPMQVHRLTWKGVLAYFFVLTSISAALFATAAAVSAEHTYLSSGIANTGITRYTSNIHVESVYTTFSHMHAAISDIRDNYVLSHI
ncbi:MAG: hypothetical protein RLZZ234_240 [Candidatus Parcubacteria bacterium]|jgi:uncharacterized membrane protein